MDNNIKQWIDKGINLDEIKELAEQLPDCQEKQEILTAVFNRINPGATTIFNICEYSLNQKLSHGINCY